MKKIVEVEPAEYSSCNNCGKDLCYNCIKTEAVEYKHGIHFSGSGDGLYCNECDAALLKSGDKIHAAFRQIKSLRDEAQGWSEDFSKRGKAAEEALKRLQGEK